MDRMQLTGIFYDLIMALLHNFCLQTHKVHNNNTVCHNYILFPTIIFILKTPFHNRIMFQSILHPSDIFMCYEHPHVFPLLLCVCFMCICSTYQRKPPLFVIQHIKGNPNCLSLCVISLTVCLLIVHEGNISAHV